MKSRLYLVDAHAYLHRAYHALPPLTNSKGEPVGALYGFARTLIQILKRDKPEALAVCFDTPGPTFRHQAYANYKATRKEIAPDLIAQLVVAKPLVEAMGLKTIEKQGYEADDIMATMARKAVGQNWDVVLVTGDKDALQLVSPGIRVFNVSKGAWMDAPQVQEKFGVAPELIRDYLAIVGDSSDNVPGLKGVGPVGAVKLLKAYGSFKGAIQAAKKSDAGLTPKMVQTLKDGEKTADLSLSLIALDENVPLEAEVEQCRVKEPDPVQLLQGLERFEFKSLAKDLGTAPSSDKEKRLATSRSEGTGKPEVKAVEYKTLAKDLIKASTLIVTAVPDAAEDGELLSSSRVRLGIGLEDGRVSLFDEAATKKKEVNQLLEGPALKVGWDLKATRRLLDLIGQNVEGPYFDTKIAAYCLDPGASKDPKADTPLDNVLARASVSLGRQEITSKLAKIGVKELFEKVEMPLCEILREMENDGVLVDTRYLGELSREFASTLKALQNEIEKLAGAPINPQSSKQLAEILFDKLGLPVVHKTAKGGRSTDEEALQVLSAQHALPAKVLEFREIAKLESTYVKGLLQHVDSKTGRVHTNFDQAGTLTGRLSSLDPNLQNIPIRTEAGRRIRRAFIAPKGWKLVSADYSQIDLRVLAHESGDENLIASFQRGEDIHARTAAEIFHVAADQVTSDQRRAAKAINFGIVYGQTAFGLSAQLGISHADASSYIKNYLVRYPKVSMWFEKNLENAKKEGGVRTLLGRVRWLPDLSAKNTALRQFTERAARNTPIQGGSADIIKLAMLDINRELKKKKLNAKMLLQVHDELVFEVENSNVGDFSTWVKTVMQNATKLRVPLVVDVKMGSNWQDMEKIA